MLQHFYSFAICVEWFQVQIGLISHLFAYHNTRLDVPSYSRTSDEQQQSYALFVKLDHMEFRVSSRLESKLVC